MAPEPNGLRRDLHLVRRRAWLFLPFLFLGILVAYAFGSVAGDANAVATFTLDTVVQNITPSGDRGFRIFEAESMTGDEAFKQKVVERIGDEGFDYGRFSTSLSPIAIADGVSRGTMSVSVSAPKKVDAERFRQAFVDVFIQEYTAADGLFRTRFIAKKQEVVDAAEKNFEEQYAKAKPLADAAKVPLDEFIRPRFEDNLSLLDALNQSEAELRRDLALATAAGNAADVQRLTAAVASLQSQRNSLSDGGLSPELRRLVADLRGAQANRTGAYDRLNDARTAAASAQSDVEVSYSFSGGLAGSLLGRIAVVIAITLVFGLIAIYAWEWLSQVRSGMPAPRGDPPPGAS